MFRLRIDRPLLAAIMLLAVGGLILLYSAADGDWHLVIKQAVRLCIGLLLMMVVARIPPRYIRLATPWLFGIGLLLLCVVLLAGSRGKGAERWLNLGFFEFQPSEVMKLALPLTLAWYLYERPLPPRWYDIVVAAVIIALPAGLIALQPDLGTAVLIVAAGALTLFLAGLSSRYVILAVLLIAATGPIAWHFMHAYQRERVLVFLNPERDPLGAGYHIIQSKIAIGSGGAFGQGWLNSSQAKLDFLPESTTDFVFAVFSEEFGFIGVLALLILYGFIVLRGLIIASRAQSNFTRLAAGGIILTFFLYVFVNIGMVSGLLPVVGVPLPLISYGGTSIVTVLLGFGILLSIASHRRLIES